MAWVQHPRGGAILQDDVSSVDSDEELVNTLGTYPTPVASTGQFLSNPDPLPEQAPVPAAEGAYEVKADYNSRPSLAQLDSLALAGGGDGVYASDHYGENDENDGAAARRRRQKRMGMAACLLLLAVIVLSVTLTQTRDKNNNPKVTGEEEEDNVFAQQNKKEAPLEPEPVVPEEEEEEPEVVENPLKDSAAYQILAPVVEDPALLLDPLTPEGAALAALVEDANGSLGSDDPFTIKQRYALMVMYIATHGEDWDWNFGWRVFAGDKVVSDDECLWYGVNTCRYQTSNGKRAVAYLGLDSNGLKGTLPSAICLLEKLEILEVQNNQMTGELPACLATAMPSLQKLDASNNQFSGPIPAGFFGLEELESLNLSGNDLSGELDQLFAGIEPADDGSYPAYEQLTHLLLNDNGFTGPVPGEFIFLTALQTLKLQNNDLTGSVNAVCDAYPDISLFADCNGEVECSCCAACTGK